MKAFRKSNKKVKWTSATNQKVSRTKFVCGSRGYDELVEQKQLLSSQRTLFGSLQDIEFSCGVLDEVFTLMKVKVSAMEECERDITYCITLDGMKIQLKIDWDRALD